MSGHNITTKLITKMHYCTDVFLSFLNQKISLGLKSLILLIIVNRISDILSALVIRQYFVSNLKNASLRF